MEMIYILGVSSSYFKDLKNNYIQDNVKVIFINETSILKKILLKIALKLNLSIVGNILLSTLKGKKILNERTSKIILFDSDYNYYSLQSIREKYNNANIIFWFWNIKNKDYNIDYIRKYTNNIYTFDYKEAEKYGIKWQEAFYWRKLDADKKEEEYDVIYIGNLKSKQRLNELEEIYNTLNKNNFKLFFYIVDKNKKWKSEFLEIQDTYMEYSKYLEVLKKSKVILELVEEGQSGFTLRTLESLFFNKKLLTNNKSLLSNIVVGKENIQIIGEQINIDFIYKKVKKYNEKELEKYYIDNWIKNLK